MVQLDGPQRLVLREVVAVGDGDRFRGVAVALLFDEFVGASNKRGSGQYTLVSSVKLCTAKE